MSHSAQSNSTRSCSRWVVFNTTDVTDDVVCCRVLCQEGREGAGGAGGAGNAGNVQ